MQYQGRREESYSLLYKATWNYEWRSAAYYQLATLDCFKSDYTTALEHIEASLDTNRQNNKAYILKAVILNRLGKKDDSDQLLVNLLKTDPLDQWARHALADIRGDYTDFLESSRNDAQTIIDIAIDYAEAGFYKEAIGLLELHHSYEIPESAVPNPMKESVMTFFILAWLYETDGNTTLAEESLNNSNSASYDYLFPSRIYEQIILEWALHRDGNNAVAAYGLGNYYYNLKRHKDAISAWEKAVASKSNYGTLYRNLGIAYWNVSGNGEKARASFLRAIELSPGDMRIRYEYDQLRKKINDSPRLRLESLEKIKDKVIKRDDFSVELAALYNFNGKYKEALDILENHDFHPWEGGEGQIVKQYTYSCLMLGRLALSNDDAERALEFFEKSFNTPDNLGEKYHPLQAVSHINYWKGMTLLSLGKEEEARLYFLKSKNEDGDFIDMAVSSFSEMSYYKALSLLELGEEQAAHKLLMEIKEFGKAKLKQKAQIDYFATSLPLLLVFEDDIQKGNTIEAKYLIALAETGLGKYSAALNLLEDVLQSNAMHTGAKDLQEELT